MQAQLNLSYTHIVAPEDGSVADKLVERGNYVEPGQTLLSLVPTAVYVVANFEETQLHGIGAGSPASVSVDALPGLRLRGHVDSIQRGTGSQFALLPPENATGNFVKIVQRIPVKIVLDEPPRILSRLAPGMSAVVSVQLFETSMVTGRPRLALGRWAVVGGLAMLSGCTVGPSYVRPEVDLPARFTERAAPADQAEGIELDWWQGLGDPLLDRLITEGVAGSPSLEIARDADHRGARGAGSHLDRGVPEVDLASAYARQRGSEHVPVGTAPGGLGPGIDSSLWLTGFDASWEADIFGGTRRAVESARASVSAAVDDQRGHSSCSSPKSRATMWNCAPSSGAWPSPGRFSRCARIISSWSTARFDSGLTGALDAARARADLADSESDIPAIETAERAAIYRLGELIGRPPETLLSMLIIPPHSRPSIPRYPWVFPRICSSGDRISVPRSDGSPRPTRGSACARPTSSRISHSPAPPA